jgi:hypothetical protein
MAALVAQLGLETVCYRAFTQYSSRLAIVRGTHFAGGGKAGEEDASTVQLSGFFEMFKKLDREWHILLALAAIGAVWLLLTRGRQRKRGTIVVLAGASHVALLGFSTQLWQRPLPRYMDPAVPFAAICAGVGVAVGLRNAVRLLRAIPRLSIVATRVTRLSRDWRLRLAATSLLIAIAGGLTYRDQLAHPSLDGYEHGARVARLANNAYDRNLPLMSVRSPDKVLMAFYNVYLHDKDLVRNGILPNYAAARTRIRGGSYLVKDRSGYSKSVFAQLQEAGCVLELRRGPKSQGMKGCADIARREPLPARCDALLGSLTQPQAVPSP